MIYRYLESPLGQLLLAGEGERLRHIRFPEGKKPLAPATGWQKLESAFSEACKQLGEYFAGRRKVFDLQLAPTGTAFQLSVLAALRQIPYGATLSYGQLAQRLGRPQAVRAVGAANGRNPLPIVIPCHRVIGADGSLTGFGGGLEAKRFLLNLEGASQQ